jgi:hypothetical protein
MISPAPYPLVLTLAPRIVPLVLSLSKDEESADTLLLMVQQAHHERFLIACTTPLVLSLSKDEREPGSLR